MIRFYSEVNDGKLNNQQLFNDCLTEFNDKAVEIIIRKVKNDKTSKQLGYYFGVLIEIVKKTDMFCDYSKQQIHEDFAKMFLSYTMFMNGKTTKGVMSLEHIERDEMSVYITQVIAFLAGHGIIVPELEENESSNNSKITF